MTIGEKIRERRIQLEMTQEELAKRTGYKSRSSIQKIECLRDLPLKKAKVFANVLDLPVSYLMGWEEIEWQPSTQEIYKKKPSLFINHADGTKEPIYGIHEAAEQAYYLDEKTKEIAEFLHKNPEYSVLFDASKKVKPEDMQKALKAINLFIDEE
mgnify:CR=1 FL=1